MRATIKSETLHAQMKNAGGLVPDAMIIPLKVRRSGTGEAAALFIGKARGFFKDLHEHCASKLASLGVLVRGMIRSQERPPVGDLVLRAVLEKKRRPPLDNPELFEMTQIGVESNLAQRDDHLRLL